MDANLAHVFRTVAATIPDRECIVWRDRRLTYAQVDERTNRLANHLLATGVREPADRAGLAGHESGQDLLAIYAYNGNEYLEAMLGSFKARVAPFNVNYRYVAEELEYLLNDAGATAIVYQATFAPLLAEVLPRVPSLRILLQVEDGSGHELLPGAVDYEAALAAASPTPPAVDPSPDDLYVLYTGGTTGMPKGVLWRQADIWVSSMGGRDFFTKEEFDSIDQVIEAARNGGTRSLPAPPFMHGAAHWAAFTSFTQGNTLVIQDHTERLEPSDIWDLVQREKVNILLMVGDAFAKPLVAELDRAKEAGEPYDLSTMFAIVSGGAILSAPMKAALLGHLPACMVVDGLGSSETGTQASQVSAAGAATTTGTFTPAPGMAVVSEDLSRKLAPGDPELGWLAQEGRVPLGYKGDAEKTARTFPVIDGVRYSVPGDRSRLLADGTLELHGRDSVTISSGGEKIFAEEVEHALAHHPAVFDVVVAGRPSERWGSEVVAIVQVRQGASVTEDELLHEAEKHIARYKLPKGFVFVDKVTRSPSGKADYRWAQQVAADA